MFIDPKSDAKSWENYFKDVLRKFYGPSGIKDIPDSYGGDFGIECYSFCGHAFQCYLPEQESDKEKLTKAQKNKIRKDIHKLTVKNIDKFGILFEGMKVSRWILATSAYVDSEMALYCSAKSGKVRRSGLPYISEDFQILIQTEADYKAEVRSIKQSVYQLTLQFNQVDEEQAGTWIADNLDFLNKMDIKLPKITADDKIHSTKAFLVQKYLGFQNLLNNLMTEWPDIHSRLTGLISNRKSYLESRFLIDSSSQSAEVIKAEIEKLKNDIIEEIPTLKRTDVEFVTWGVIADWIICCPLDF